MRVRIKVCGMTRAEDAAAAARLGVDAVGLVFYPKSPRYVSVEQAKALVKKLPAFVTVTALFLDPTREDVQKVLDGVRVELLQFHGNEPPEFCHGFGRPYIKAVPMGSQADIADYARRYHDAAALLLDSHVQGQKGGTGKSFTWSSLPKVEGPPLILAGGLNSENVGTAISVVHPYGVDVSSGVESAPGSRTPTSLPPSYAR
ncbi:MAG TPA: phosphoribosylanthranilate isomerase [Gammaproteobacteria bacterium]|nr:phosphoribosylanthranilate isomerase [Gammaproteobacteria bacterium]